MSKKILVDDITIKTMLHWLDCLPYDLEGDANLFKLYLESELENSKKKHYSVLEWHDVKEAPSSNAERVFVEYSDGGFGFIFGHPEIIKDDPDYKRWSYLPE